MKKININNSVDELMKKRKLPTLYDLNVGIEFFNNCDFMITVHRPDTEVTNWKKENIL